MNPVDELNFLLGIGPPRPALPITLQKSGYTSVRSLGKGSFGQALLLFHKTKQQYFVAKYVNLTNMNTRQRRDAHNEISILQQMHHPNIIRYVECFEEHPHLYIVMEYADGGDLYSHLQRIAKLKLPYECNNKKNISRLARMGPLTEAQVISLFIQTMMALKYMHDRRILHRDIKSQNVFLTKNHVVKLGDFGITTILQNTVAMASTMCGTPCYFSPELCRGEAYNNKSDIWAAGVLLYEMTSVRLPFESTTMKALMREIISKEPRRIPSSYSDELWNLIKWMLEKDPKRRPDAAAVLRSPVLMRQIPNIITLLKNTEDDEEIVNLLNDQATYNIYKKQTGNNPQTPPLPLPSSSSSSSSSSTQFRYQQNVYKCENQGIQNFNAHNEKEFIVNKNDNNQFEIHAPNEKKDDLHNIKAVNEHQLPIISKADVGENKELRNKNEEIIHLQNENRKLLRDVKENAKNMRLQRERAEIKDLLARFDRAKERVSVAKKPTFTADRKSLQIKCEGKQNKIEQENKNKICDKEKYIRENETLEVLTPSAVAAVISKQKNSKEYVNNNSNNNNNSDNNKKNNINVNEMLTIEEVNYKSTEVNTEEEKNVLLNRKSLNEELDEMIKEMSDHFSNFELSQKESIQLPYSVNKESIHSKSKKGKLNDCTKEEAHKFINDEFTDNANNVLDIEQLEKEMKNKKESTVKLSELYSHLEEPLALSSLPLEKEESPLESLPFHEKKTEIPLISAFSEVVPSAYIPEKREHVFERTRECNLPYYENVIRNVKGEKLSCELSNKQPETKNTIISDQQSELTSTVTNELKNAVHMTIGVEEKSDASTEHANVTGNNSNLFYNTECLCKQTQLHGLVSSIYGSFVCNCAVCVRIGCNAAGIEWLHLPETYDVKSLLSTSTSNMDDVGNDERSSERPLASAAGAGVAAAATILVTRQQKRKEIDKNEIEAHENVKLDLTESNALEEFTFKLYLENSPEQENDNAKNTSENCNISDGSNSTSGNSNSSNNIIVGCNCSNDGNRRHYDGQFTVYFCKYCGTYLALLHDEKEGLLLTKTSLDDKSAKLLEEFAHTVTTVE